MKETLGIVGLIILIIALIALIGVGPILTLMALNALFQLHIAYSIGNWLAVVWLSLLFTT
jgi:hypothetical protein